MFRVVIGMSDELKAIRTDIKNVAPQLDLHLIKLALYPYCSAVDHWRAEVYSLLWRVNKVKGKNKYPKYSLIREALAINEDTLEDMIEAVKQEYSNLVPVDKSNTDIVDVVMLYHDWIATQLSQKGVLRPSIVNEELKSLGL